MQARRRKEELPGDRFIRGRRKRYCCGGVLGNAQLTLYFSSGLLGGACASASNPQPTAIAIEPLISFVIDIVISFSSCQQSICYQGTMTAPRNGFGAHSCDSLRLRKFYAVVCPLPPATAQSDFADPRKAPQHPPVEACPIIYSSMM
jgi:hypothetical protein